MISCCLAPEKLPTMAWVIAVGGCSVRLYRCMAVERGQWPPRFNEERNGSLKKEKVVVGFRKKFVLTSVYLTLSPLPSPTPLVKSNG